MMTVTATEWNSENSENANTNHCQNKKYNIELVYVLWNRLDLISVLQCICYKGDASTLRHYTGTKK